MFMSKNKKKEKRKANNVIRSDVSTLYLLSHLSLLRRNLQLSPAGQRECPPTTSLTEIPIANSKYFSIHHLSKNKGGGGGGEVEIMGDLL